MVNDAEIGLRLSSLTKPELTQSLDSLSTWWKWQPEKAPSEVSFTTFIDTEKSVSMVAASDHGTKHTEHVEHRQHGRFIPTALIPPTPAIPPEKLRLMKALQMRKKQQALVTRASAVSTAPELETETSVVTGPTKGESGNENISTTAPDPLQGHSIPSEKLRLMKALQTHRRQQVLAKRAFPAPELETETSENMAHGKGESREEQKSHPVARYTVHPQTRQYDTGNTLRRETNTVKRDDPATKKR